MTTFFSLELLIRIITSFVATVGFAIIFKVKRRHLLASGIAGVITYFVYYIFEFIGAPLFTAALISTTVAAIYAEIYARINRAPAIIVLSAAVIPTVPGGSLYYSVQHILTEEHEEAFMHLGNTLGIGLGIACGIVLVSIVSKIITEKLEKRKKA